jgi:hypothetical protein
MSIFSFGRSPSGGNTQQQEVFLNVYDLHENNDTFYPIGLGFYHSGVQIGRDEYTFGMCKVMLYFMYISKLY